MRKALNSRSPFHMDFFTVDLNEEYSALYGGVLESQTEFVRQSIFRILELYKNNKSFRPTSVVLVGHSMVGIFRCISSVNFCRNLTYFMNALNCRVV